MSTLHEVRDAESRPFLRALGLTDACELRLCKAGEPCIVQVRSTRIGLSGEVARGISRGSRRAASGAHGDRLGRRSRSDRRRGRGRRASR